MSITSTTVAGIQLTLREGNASKSLVMLHGIGSNRHSFDPLIKYLPTDLQLLAWNAPGYGTSTALEIAAPTAEHYARKLHELTQALDLTRFVLLGHSLGTLIATAYARHYPDCVGKLILLACAQGQGMHEGNPLPDKAQLRLTDLARLGPQAFAEARAPRLIHAPESRPQVLAAAVKAMAQINSAGYQQAVYMLAAGNLSGMAAGVQNDSLTITGTEDQITPPAQTQNCHTALLAANRNAEHIYVQVPDAGHLVHQEHPAVVARHIMEFTGWRQVGSK